MTTFVRFMTSDDAPLAVRPEYVESVESAEWPADPTRYTTLRMASGDLHRVQGDFETVCAALDRRVASEAGDTAAFQGHVT